eukprot:CAMPEP_0175059300 /NCGR_PEP_ID=MMETSP0052_2-20121109/12355_1 /TAXON_ID=51329 ORGANISM="Polytomella parva, Strain SAG 63-3" /NCGR_SAMPLE_ID=MMETSP0052_2 /ASSEMBLY_ACC=CAM_ASM_000194 /LENGTH=366 /DNA_ID=CAMNT_0016324833 /DNA_START=253 /DNA_END=1353 /DNA_ORIENTATION=-
MSEPFEISETSRPEFFRYSLFLVLCNRLMSCGLAVSGLIWNRKVSEIKPVAPLWTYAAASVSNVIATTCQYEALKYVTFPVQTLGKCAKMLPVMLWGIVILRKKYGLKDFGLALSITMGCTLFLVTGDIKSKVSHSLMDSSIYGVILMGTYLGFDGFTSTFQDKLFKGYQMTTYNQVLYVTLFSALLSLFGLLSSGQLPEALSFVQRHQDAWWSVVILSAAASMGSLFISYTIRTFGSLVFATIMTTRQFLSILLSCLIFAHPLSGGQWVGTAVVFGSLYYQGFSRKSGHGKAKSSKSDEDFPSKPLLDGATSSALNDESEASKAVATSDEPPKGLQGLQLRPRDDDEDPEVGSREGGEAISKIVA